MSYDFENISYSEMIDNARQSLDFGTKEEIEAIELEEYFSFSDDSDDEFDYPKDEDGFYILPDVDLDDFYQGNLSNEDLLDLDDYGQPDHSNYGSDDDFDDDDDYEDVF